jgi:hypothetical protein
VAVPPTLRPSDFFPLRQLLIDHGGDDWFPISRDSVSHRRPSADALSLAAPHRPAADVRAGLLFSPSRRPGEATSSRAVPSRPCAAGSRAAPASCFLQTSAPTAVSEVPSPASPPVDASMFRPVPPRGATDVRAGCRYPPPPPAVPVLVSRRRAASWTHPPRAVLERPCADGAFCCVIVFHSLLSSIPYVLCEDLFRVPTFQFMQ